MAAHGTLRLQPLQSSCHQCLCPCAVIRPIGTELRRDWIVQGTATLGIFVQGHNRLASATLGRIGMLPLVPHIVLKRRQKKGPESTLFRRYSSEVIATKQLLEKTLHAILG